jgi:hypothetical protein
MRRRIEAEHEVRASVDEVARLLAEDPAAVLGRRQPGTAGAPEYVADPEAGLAGPSLVHQEVSVRLEEREPPVDGGHSWHLSCRPAGRNRSMPSLGAVMHAVSAGRGTRLRLHGTYRPPLGPAAAVGDGVLGHRVAHRSVVTFLAGLAGRIDGAVDARRASADGAS